jgi:hypothetical protein
MDILVITLILVVIAFLLFYFLHSTDDENSSIPYVKHQSYPIVGHLFAFIRDRTKFLMECQQLYGKCFKIRVLNKRFTLVLSPSDWASIIRNQSFYFPGHDHAGPLFDISTTPMGKYQTLI